ncbi:hypothetical protein KL86DES1_21065 [uncultured Desulfovibrio sp.]|uniref:Uncharacterized protein n=1 Tax=uncultured Desulfovibrio sp. TaxID=167968 RepID=A0A212L739_9BACT|nr:hypothetical protein KL86DES1_21065 [uncultured Desulfovibrio sp.]
MSVKHFYSGFAIPRPVCAGRAISRAVRAPWPSLGGKARMRPVMAEIAEREPQAFRGKSASKWVTYDPCVTRALARKAKIKDCPCRRRAAARLVWRAF